MSLVNKSNLDVANTAIITAVNSVFDGITEKPFQQFTTVTPAEGTSVDIVVVDGLPRPREWVSGSAKQYHSLRAYKKNIARRKWEATFELDRIDLDGDKSGVVGQRAAAFAQRQGSAYDQVVTEALLANSITSYNGQPLLSNSHPNVNGSTYDNLTTSALSHAEFKTAMQTMELWTDENGEPLQCYGTTLMVGPANRQKAMEVTGSNRLVAVSNAGAQDATSNVVAAGLLENYIGGSVQVIVNPLFRSGAQWFLFDLSKSVKPFGLAEWRKPEIISQLDMNSPSRFELDVYRWSLEFDASPYPLAPQYAYGSVTA